MLVRTKGIERQIVDSMMEVSKVKFLSRPIHHLELRRRGGGGGVDVAEGEAVGEVGGGDGGVEVGEVE
jgi:hypothetical protein